MHYKLIFSLLITFLLSSYTYSQVEVSGPCFGGMTYTLPSLGMVNGKEAFDGMGTVAGNPNIQISVYWEPAGPGWVLAFSGQPFYLETNNTGLPNSTSAGNWSGLGGEPCPISAITIAGASTLPVELAYFKGEYRDEKSYLSWQTVNEKNNLGFEVERSTDTNSWYTLGFIEGAENSSINQNYNFEDKEPFVGVNYYRLRQVDIDGTYKYSDIINVRKESGGLHVIAYPNPATNQLFIKGDNIQNAKISVYNQFGILLKSIVVSENYLEMDLSSFQKGNYIMEIKKDNVVTMKSFVII